MKKLFTMILAAATMVACGTANKMVVNGDLSLLEKVAADNTVELRISGSEEALATTTLDANKCFTAEVTLPADDFVMVVVNDPSDKEARDLVVDFCGLHADGRITLKDYEC